MMFSEESNKFIFQTLVSDQETPDPKTDDGLWKYHEPKATQKICYDDQARLPIACAELKYLPRGSLCKASEQMLTFHYFSGFQQPMLANRLRQGP